MKIIDGLIQGSDAWHNFRETHIGASNSAAILGMSPYQTAIEVFNEKTSRSFGVAENDNMRLGTAMEPKIREAWEMLTGKKFETPTVEHTEYPFISASFDGWHELTNSVIECKYSRYPKLVNCLLKQDVEHFKEVYPQYHVQCQHLMFVSGATECTLITLDPANEIVSLVIPRDDQFITEILFPGIKSFWEDRVMKDVPPPPPEDSHIVVDDLQALTIADQLQDLLTEEKDLKERKEVLRTRLFEFGDDGNFIVGKLRMTRTSRTTVDYKKACADAGIDLAPYTKEGIGYYTIKQIK